MRRLVILDPLLPSIRLGWRVTKYLRADRRYERIDLDMDRLVPVAVIRVERTLHMGASVYGYLVEYDCGVCEPGTISDVQALAHATRVVITRVDREEFEKLAYRFDDRVKPLSRAYWLVSTEGKVVKATLDRTRGILLYGLV